MQPITDKQGRYTTTARRLFPLARIFPSLFYYTEFLIYVFRYSPRAKRGLYSAEDWWYSSLLAL